MFWSNVLSSSEILALIFYKAQPLSQALVKSVDIVRINNHCKIQYLQL